MSELRILDACLIGEYLTRGTKANSIALIVNNSNYECWLHGENLREFWNFVYQSYFSRSGNAVLAQQKSDAILQQVTQWNLLVFNSFVPALNRSIRNLMNTQGFTRGEASIVALTTFLVGYSNFTTPGKLVTTDAQFAAHAGTLVQVELIP